MAGQSWYESAPLVEEKQPQRGGGVFIPDQGAIDDAQRADTSLGLQVQGNERDSTRLGNDARNQNFNQLRSISDAYNRDPTISGYRESLGNFATGLRTSATPQGDNALITAYVKVFDPGSVVNEGEREGAASGQGYFASQVEAAKRNFGMDGAGLFTPEARQRIRSEMANIMGKRVKGYNQRRDYYTAQADAFGIDPKLVIGAHDADPFVPQFREYDRQNKLGEFSRQRQDKPFAGVDPNDITFDLDTGTGAFGSELKVDRMTPQQQAAFTAALQANAGNQNFGPETLKAIYQSVGYPVGQLPDSPEFYDAVRNGGAFGTTPDYSQADAARRKWAEDQVRAEMQAQGMETINSAPSSDKGWTLGLSDELAGVRDGISNLITGNGTFSQGYQDGRDITRAAQRMSRDQNGLAPEIISGLMVPGGVINRANLARDALAMGAIAGFGEGEGATDSLSKAVTGAALGYGGGKAVDAAAPVIRNSAVGQRVRQFLDRQPDPAIVRFADAAERQGLDYLPADVPGATKTRFATSITRATIGGVPLAEAASKIASAARDARDRIAGNVGEVSDNVGVGQSTQSGMQAWKAATGDRGGALYDAIPIRPDARVDLSDTRQTLAGLNNGITSNDDLAALVRDPKLVQYQQALEKGDLSWNDIKKFRSYIGEKAGRPTLQQDTSKDSLDALYGALSRDIERAAAAHSPEAAKAFSRANNYWRGRQARISDVMTKLVGKDGNLSPEATFSQIERWASAKGGDFTSLSRAIRSLPEEEANTVRATIIDRLGDSGPGAQNASNDNFSPDVFLTQWSKLSDRAKGVLFQGEHRKALDDLATVFEGTKFSRGFDNNSRTGLVNTALSSGALALVDPVSGLGVAALQYGSGKLLASPRVARWLVALAKKPNPSAQLAHIGQLTAIARSEPIIANDILSLQQRLAEVFSEPLPGRLAAEENDPKRRGPPKEGESGNAQ